MYDLVITGARLADDRLVDLAVKDGKIAEVGQLADDVHAHRRLDLAGNCRLSAGWIDSHVHCYPSSPIYHDQPDLVGTACGVTTVVDAGSTGTDDVDAFYTLTRSSKTNVFAFLNISRIGLLRQNELADLADIDKQKVSRAIDKHAGFVIGIKARMSSSVVGQNGIRPLVLAKEIQQENNLLPLMVHIGNNPPDLDEIADLLTRGDIITHCYNGKPNRILTPAGTLRESIQRALKRGVLLDVGHRQLQLRGGASGDSARHFAAYHQFRYLLPQPDGRAGTQPGDGDVQILQHWAIAAAGDCLRYGKCRLGAAPVP